MITRISFPGFKIGLPAGWGDITDTLEGLDRPFTLAKRAEVGALQFSPAIYKSGPVPSPTSNDLQAMVLDFGRHHGMGEAFDLESFEEPLLGAAASYRSKGDFIRVWYLSDQKSFMLATYLCEWKDRDAELAESEAIVRSIQFDPSTDGVDKQRD